MSTIRTFTPDVLSPGGSYHVLNAVIAPRPISWISSVAEDGTFNLAPHSYTTVVSPNPPIVAFVTIGRKDTLRNVERSGCFVYNIGSRSLVERINRSSADFPPNVSEFEWAGLTPVAGVKVAAPRVLEAPVQMEAELVGVQRVADTENYIVTGQVVAFHVYEDLYDEHDRIDTRRLDPVGRMAGALYAAMGEVFSLARPTYQGLLDEGARPMEPLGSC